jgi:hypothetical protein
METIDKKGEVDLYQWVRKHVVVSLYGVVKMFKTKAHVAWTYSSTCVNACAWCNHVDGGEERSKAISKNLQEAKV